MGSRLKNDYMPVAYTKTTKFLTCFTIAAKNNIIHPVCMVL